MKKFTRFLAIVIAITILAVAGCGCHEKDEIAYTINEHEFTSAMYSCVLYVSASEARTAIYDYVTENKGDTTKIVYKDYKFDDKGEVSETGNVSYNQYVEEKALDRLIKYAVVADEMAKAGVKLDDEALDNIKLTCEYYWYAGCDVYTYQQYVSYGVDPSQYFAPYYSYFEPNGVAYTTYEKYMIYEQSYRYYFDHIYGEDGEKAVPKEELTEYLTTHYDIADVISFSKTNSEGKDLSADELTKLKEKADKYAERINAGEEFSKVYEEYQKSLSDSSSSNTTTNSTTSNSTTDKTENSTEADKDKEDKEEKYTPEEYKAIFGDAETEYDSNAFAEIHKSEYGKAVVFDDTENKQYLLFVRRDITEQDYWMENFIDGITFALRQDEFDAGLDALSVNYKAVEDKHATSPFTVDKVKF